MDARGPLSPLVVALVLAGTTAWADADHERARAAREAGKIVAFQTILDRVQAEFPGTVPEVELEEDDGRWIYKAVRGLPFQHEATADGSLVGTTRAVTPPGALQSVTKGVVLRLPSPPLLLKYQVVPLR